MVYNNCFQFLLHDFHIFFLIKVSENYKFRIVSLFQLFSDVFVDDPWFMSEIAQFQVEQVQNDTAQTKKMGKEKQMQMLQAVGRLLDVSLSSGYFMANQACI